MPRRRTRFGSGWQVHGRRSRRILVVCLDARPAKAALGRQVSKADRNDAPGLAQIVRTGPPAFADAGPCGIGSAACRGRWRREVRVKDLDQHARRALLTSRGQLVRLRGDLASRIGGVLKPFGLAVGKCGGEPFAARARELDGTVPALPLVVEALLAAWRGTREQVAALDRPILRLARDDASSSGGWPCPGSVPSSLLPGPA